MYLVSAKEPYAANLVLTENVSRQGARILAKRAAQPGDLHQITVLSGAVRLHARVVYCQGMSKNNFRIGLKLQNSSVEWWSAA
jgi:hypothetical protein